MADETPENEQDATQPTAGQPATAGARTASKRLTKEERARRDHLAKSQRGPRTAAERDAERRELRKSKAVARRRRREQEKAKRTASAPDASGASDRGTPPAPPKDSSPQVRVGTVVSAKADKTIVVRIDHARRHRKYEKIVRSTTKLHAHDEANDAHEGDLVRVTECRPLSRTKRWKLVEVLERAK